MKGFKNDQSGFTLIEMMIVIIIISTLLMIAVPQMSKSNKVVSGKSCDVTVKLLQSQVAAYEAEKGMLPSTLQDLVDADYVDKVTCPGGETLLFVDGEVQIEQPAETPTSS